MIVDLICSKTAEAVSKLFSAAVDVRTIQVEKTNREYDGDLTVVVFPLLRYTKKSPELSGQMIGEYLTKELSEIENFSVVKGFLNLNISQVYWLDFFEKNLQNKLFGICG